MKRNGLLLSALVVVVLVSLFIFGPSLPDKLKQWTGGGAGLVKITNSSDPLCAYVNNSGMRCVMLLGSDSLLGPGAFVDFPGESNPQSRVPLPNGDLFSQACLVPGAETTVLLESLKQQTQNAVAIPTMTYQLDRSLKIGVDLPIPKVPSLVLKAGPQWSQTTAVQLVAPQAWVKIVDENLFLNALASSGIRKTCVDRLLASKYRIVSKALVVKDLHYEISDKSGQSYSADLAVQKGLLHASTGGGTDINVKQAEQTVATMPVVLGVEFLSADLLRQKPQLNEPVLFSASGQTNASLSGSGGGGHLPDMSSAPTPLGSVAQVQSQGSESSECESGHDLTRSQGQISAVLQSPTNNSIEFSATASLRGGHYATVAACVAGKAVGFTGHDNGVSVRYVINGNLRTTVRSDDASLLNATFSGLPSQSTLSVRDPKGQLLAAGDRAPGTVQVSGDGNLSFRLHGAGVYFVELSTSNGKSVNGASPDQIADKGKLSVTVQ